MQGRLLAGRTAGAAADAAAVTQLAKAIVTACYSMLQQWHANAWCMHPARKQHVGSMQAAMTVQRPGCTAVMTHPATDTSTSNAWGPAGLVSSSRGSPSYTHISILHAASAYSSGAPSVHMRHVY